MSAEKTRIVKEFSEEQVITLNGIKANAYPSGDQVLISNNDFELETSWDELVVPFETFIDIMENNDGNFRC